MGLAKNALLALMDAVQAATARGVRPEALGDARVFHRKAQWRLDSVAAENSNVGSPRTSPTDTASGWRAAFRNHSAGATEAVPLARIA